MTLHVDRRGRGADLVLLHGWGTHSGVWAELLPVLSSHHRVHAIDLPGHGFSASQRPESLDACADAVADVIPDGSVVCGWSLGGQVALRLARRHPARARKLALVSATPCFVQREGWREAMEPATLATFARELHADRRATLERFVRLNALNGTRSREAVRAFSRKLFDRGPPSDRALLATLAWLGTSDLRAEAAHVTQPTLVIHGARDMLAPVSAGRWLAATIPGATLLELADAAHLPFFTHGDEFVRALEPFLA